jgi:hypothetical protein
MDKKKDSMAGMTSAQKAAVLKGRQRSNKDKIAKMGPLEDTWYRDKSGNRAVAGRLRQGNVDMSRTIGRLESSDARKKTSATYRLAKMKAENKARKAARKAGKMDPDAQPGFRPAPFLTKNKKKGNK